MPVATAEIAFRAAAHESLTPARLMDLLSTAERRDLVVRREGKEQTIETLRELLAGLR